MQYHCEICKTEVTAITFCCWCDRTTCDTCLSVGHYKDEACHECDCTDQRAKDKYKAFIQDVANGKYARTPEQMKMV